MKTDRELLELAAKAAGLWIRWHDESFYGPTMELMEDESGGPPWNPLTDDGDALRLAVAIAKKSGFAHSQNIVNGLPIIEGDKTDLGAATRRAIVRAAAAIGEQA